MPSRAAEQIRRRRESVTRLKSLARRDPEMWAEPLADAEDRLRATEAIFARHGLPTMQEQPSRETHVIVGDHQPERRATVAEVIGWPDVSDRADSAVVNTGSGIREYDGGNSDIYDRVVNTDIADLEAQRGGTYGRSFYPSRVEPLPLRPVQWPRPVGKSPLLAAPYSRTRAGNPR